MKELSGQVGKRSDPKLVRFRLGPRFAYLVQFLFWLVPWRGVLGGGSNFFFLSLSF